VTIETSIGLGTGQPYPYQRVELVEPDWTRFPGWKDVTAADWESVQWQRAHCVKNLKQLRELLGVRRLSLPDAAEALAVTGYERGAITPFGASRAWPVILDASAAVRDRVAIGGGAHGVNLHLDPVDLVTALDATIADVTVPEAPEPTAG
jgi:hypothetical protein